jgi:[protein-PII] uridylyltransferase
MTDLSVLDPLIARRERLLQTTFERNGLDWCAEHTEIADEVIRLVFREIVGDAQPNLAILATGGYGRCELAPYSDIDLTLVTEDETNPEVDPLIRRLFKVLGDAFARFGLTVGYAYRLIYDVPGLDGETRTGLIDARFLEGSHRIASMLMDALWEEFPVGDFLLAKLGERENAIRKTHTSPLVVEPHLKDGAGGLRSFQCANWIRIALRQQPMRPTKEYETVLRYRNWLHYLYGRKNDQMTRSKQAEITDRKGGDLDRVAGELIRAMIRLDEDYHAAVEGISEARFRLGTAVEVNRGEARVMGNADPGAAAAGIALATRLDLAISSLPAGTGELRGGAEAYFALIKGERVVRNLDRCGLLAEILPELTACRTLMPRDNTHRYTVFEHSLRVLRNLENIPAGTVYERIRTGLREPERLHFVALVHDLGKNIPGRPHSESGADLVREIGARWGMDPVLVEDAAWLILHHLDMARFIRMRDVDHPDTAKDMAEIVGTHERLDLLTLLTRADISAVGPNVLTAVQDAFLRQLYEMTSEHLKGDVPSQVTPMMSRRRLQRELGGGETIPAEELERFLDALPAHYLLSAEKELVELHYRYAERAIEGSPIVEISPNADLSASEVTIAALDEPGLLSRFLAVFYALSLGVHKMRVCTVQTPPAVALDTFTVSHGGQPIPETTAKMLDSALRAVIAHEMTAEAIMRKHGLDPDRRQNVFSSHFIEGETGILEVQAPRGRGMAYRVARMITSQGWNIRAARVSQWAGRGSAAFYITGPEDRRLSAEDVESVFRSQV